MNLDHFKQLAAEIKASAEAAQSETRPVYDMYFKFSELLDTAISGTLTQEEQGMAFAKPKTAAPAENNEDGRAEFEAVWARRNNEPIVRGKYITCWAIWIEAWRARGNVVTVGEYDQLHSSWAMALQEIAQMLGLEPGESTTDVADLVRAQLEKKPLPPPSGVQESPSVEPTTTMHAN